MAIPKITATVTAASLSELAPVDGDRYEYVEDTSAAFDRLIPFAAEFAAMADQLSDVGESINAAARAAGIAASVDMDGAARGSLAYLDALAEAPVSAEDASLGRVLLAYNIAADGDKPTTEIHIAEQSSEGYRWGGALASVLTANVAEDEPDTVVVVPSVDTDTGGDDQGLEPGLRIVDGPNVSFENGNVLVNWTLDQFATGKVEIIAADGSSTFTPEHSTFERNNHYQQFAHAGGPVTLRVHSATEQGEVVISEAKTYQPEAQAAQSTDYVPPTQFSEIRVTRNAENGTSRRHAYSRRRVWNADETRMLLVENGQGVITDLLGNQVGSTSGVREWDWSTVDPNVLFACQGANVVSIDITTGAITTLWTGPAGMVALLGDSEGVIAQNRYAVVTEFNGSRMFAVDLQTGATLGTANKQPGHDWIGFDRSANHIVSNEFNGSVRDSYIYDTDLSNRRYLAHFDGHADFLVDAAGDDWTINFAQVSAVRLRDGFVRDMGYYRFGHLSGLSTAAPDWYWHSDTNEIISRSIEPGSPVINWGATNAKDNPYEAQAQVSVSPSGKRVIYASDKSGTVENYVITGS